MLKETFVIIVTNDDAGTGVIYNPPMIMKKIPSDTYPELQAVEDLIDIYKGNAATVKKEYRKY